MVVDLARFLQVREVARLIDHDHARGNRQQAPGLAGIHAAKLLVALTILPSTPALGSAWPAFGGGATLMITGA